MPRADVASRRRAAERSGYPQGTRHELTSLALVEGSDALREQVERSRLDWDLLLHLIGSHHGWCRPFAPPVLDPSPIQVEAESNGHRFQRSSDHRLARVDSGVADRFWRLTERYGWWGLPWLEAILRLADHRQSEIESTADAGRSIR
jgi:CRISPR-associated endonuclease/helicase Cas3